MARSGEKAGFRQVGEFELVGAFLDLALETRIRVLQLFGHAVELVGERLKFIARLDGDALREVAAADAGGAHPHGLDRNHHAPREEKAGQEGERKATSSSAAERQIAS